MAALHKFKFLATQCGVAQSPTRSPRTSPVVVLRRRKTTLRMLLSRSSGRRSPRRRDMPLPPPPPDSRKDAGRSLRDLFVSSPPSQGGDAAAKEKGDSKVRQAFGDGYDGLRMGPGSPRAGWIGFRNRSLLRKVWRPVLVGIPE